MFRNILALIIITSVIATAQIQDSVTTDLKIYSDTLVINPDSILTNDSLVIITKRDSIVPIYSSPLTEKSFIASNKDLLKLEYQYTGDYLRLYPFNFIKNLGSTGQPNETFLYGVGNAAVSYLLDGVSYNDRQSNSLNLNLIQSEDVDSIEMIPLTRGFLYGAYSNPVSVNFITKDFISIQPYSRIRYYQGTNRDMMFDGIFNAVVTNKLIASFDITNRIYDGTYDNTDYSIWQGKVKLKYLLSNAVNIIASYNYNDYNAGYSGGINVDSIAALGENVDDVLYSPLDNPPMVYPNGELKTLTHLPRLRFLIKPTEWMRSDASLFFMFNRYEKNTSANEYSENKTYGLNIRNDFDYSIFKFQLNVDYEKTKNLLEGSYYTIIDSVQLRSYQDEIKFNLFSIAGTVSANLLDSTIIPSVFFKTSSYNNELYDPSWESNFKEKNSSGYGADLLIKLKPTFSFYFGVSHINPYNINDLDYNVIEIGADFLSDFINADLKYFINNYSDDFFVYESGNTNNYVRGDVNGLGLNLKFNFWKLQLESNSSYYFSADNNKLIGVPEFQTQTGLYYTSVLFNNNLDLKTGFVFYYTGTNNVYTNEHGVTEAPSSYKLDFTLAGEIQKTAIVYFLWQNLLQTDYYITPYYPMPPSNIRFGFAWELFN
jgi:hypothetical protein